MIMQSLSFLSPSSETADPGAPLRLRTTPGAPSSPPIPPLPVPDADDRGMWPLREDPYEGECPCETALSMYALEDCLGLVAGIGPGLGVVPLGLDEANGCAGWSDGGI